MLSIVYGIYSAVQHSLFSLYMVVEELHVLNNLSLNHAFLSIVFIITFLTSITCWLSLNLPCLANTSLLRKKEEKSLS